MENKKILIVDDEDSMRVALSGLFIEDGYESIVCANGQEALEKWTDDITHIVSDVRMPGMDGLELVKRLKTKKNNIAVVICTANEGVLLKHEQLIQEYGLTDILSKPISFAELKNALGL